jgi:hypothetical protein
MKIFGLLLAASATWSAVAQAQAQESPFYAAFKAICGDTGADPERAKAVIAAAPFPKKIDPPIASSLFPLTLTDATIDWSGHRLSIQASMGHMPVGGGVSTDIVMCSVMSSANEDAGLAAVRKWIGLEPTSTTALVKMTDFDYRQDGSMRTPITSDAASNAAIAEGKYWSVRLTAGGITGGLYRAQLFHYLAPVGQKAK